MGGFGGATGRRKALQKRELEKRKSENKRTTWSGRGQEGHEERMGKMKGEAYYSQTDGPLNSPRPPPGTRRETLCTSGLPAVAVQRGAGPHSLKHGTPPTSVCERAHFCFVNSSTKRQICAVGWQGATSTRFPPSSTLTLFHSGVYPPDAALIVRG